MQLEVYFFVTVNVLVLYILQINRIHFRKKYFNLVVCSITVCCYTLHPNVKVSLSNNELQVFSACC